MMTQFLYKTLTSLSGPALSLLLERRLRAGKEDGKRLGERKGTAQKARPHGPLFWVHAASVGEAQSALVLIDALLAQNTALHILVTTGTLTSARLMEKRLPERALHQFAPLDHPRWTKRFLDHWKPDAAPWMESELWPNMLAQIQDKHIPAVLVNARMSQKSFRHWKIVKPFAQNILSSFSLILAQTQKDADAYESLGGKNVTVTDNLKYAAAPLPCDEEELGRLQKALGSRPVWLYASTHAGEEDLACRVHSALKETVPDLLSVIVPRHPDRRDEILTACRTAGLTCALRGQERHAPGSGEEIYIADTLGELGLFYRLCPVAVIGRSFSRDGGGGHNPVEAAQLGCAVLTGPNVQFQKQIFDEMIEKNAAVKLQSEAELETALARFFKEADTLQTAQARARDFADRKTGVLERVLTELAPVLENIQEQKDAA